jgi:hypothetical protein
MTVMQLALLLTTIVAAASVTWGMLHLRRRKHGDTTANTAAQPADEAPAQRSFTVVMRGPSACVFWPDEKLEILELQTAVGKITVEYRTRWFQFGPNVTMPGHMWIQVTGTGPNLEDVLVPYANAALLVLPVIAVATNASIEHPELEIGFDSTPGISERDYFQCFIPAETSNAKPGRRVNVDCVVALLRSLESHPERERLLRGCNQYGLALNSWRLGNEILSLAHLWMAVEALTKAVLRSEQSKRGLASQEELAKALGVDIKQLDGEVRRRLILRGDDECYKAGKSASDGLEHGFMPYDRIRSHATAAHRKLAQYIRLSILELTGIDSGILQKLLNDPFDRPIGSAPLTKYMRGQIVGSAATLSKEGNVYPILIWNATIKSAKFSADGKTLSIEPEEKLTVAFGPGLSFKPKRTEIWQD